MPYKTHFTTETDLSTPVRYLKGVGPSRAKKLQTLRIATLADLIFQSPRAWEDRRLEPEQTEQHPALAPYIHRKARSILCRILSSRESIVAAGTISIFKAQAAPLPPHPTDGPPITLCWIRRRSFKYDTAGKLRRDIRRGAVLIVHGRPDEKESGTWMVEDYTLQPIEPNPHWLRLAPLYPSTEGLSQNKLRELRWNSLQCAGARLPRWRWPADAESPLNSLMPLELAWSRLHFPNNEQELWQAKQTLAAWELFLVSLAMEIRREKMRNTVKPHQYSMPKGGPQLLKRLRSHLDFTLTAGQEEAIRQIDEAMAQPTPMNRLLQGEVGSGKTLVALAAMLKAIESSMQAVFIAPTEILAFQHALTLRKYLAPLGIESSVLTSETPAVQKQKILERAADGTLPLLVGTHALLSDDVRFKKLALIIMDEQHRFGVKQRWQMRSKACHPDCLVLSATPIPRTLALALYGDLDITTLEDLPAGRRIAQTLLADEEKAWHLMHEALKRGERAYVVVPAIEGETSAYSLEKETAKIAALFPSYRIASLHGRMPSRKKEAVMAGFAQGEHAILVATTVIEVGIDVPQATTIVILGAERYGLATLHQLRGRVGRGDREGLCILVPSQTEPKAGEELFEPKAAHERLQRFTQTRSGFEIGKLDLMMRGPGKLLGLEQHGEWDFEHFDFEHFIDLIAPVRSCARRLIKEDPQLTRHPVPAAELKRQYGHQWMVSDLS